MVLDATKNIQVPLPINAFLRSYQQEGVKFLYDKYKEDRGGLLGDDMGLVTTHSYIKRHWLTLIILGENHTNHFFLVCDNEEDRI